MALIDAISQGVAQIREKSPLVHCITNYVTVNDCANAVLAIGASPIMADDIDEVEDITSISSALVINIGTLNSRTIKSAIMAGKKANELNIPVVFDPVGAGASKLRNETTKDILNQVKITIIRGNLSEMSFIAGLSANTKGVDSSDADAGNNPVLAAKKVAELYNCTAAITGAVDTVADKNTCVQLSNGHPMLSKITGSGCLTSAITGAFASAVSNPLEAACGAILTTSIAGELAYEKSGSLGTGSFHISLIDFISTMSADTMLKYAKVKEITL